MSDVTRWLEELGLSQYARAFAENDIDLKLLARLTHQDLKELGVASLGHLRSRLASVPPKPCAPIPEEAVPKTSAVWRSMII